MLFSLQSRGEVTSGPVQVKPITHSSLQLENTWDRGKKSVLQWRKASKSIKKSKAMPWGLLNSRSQDVLSYTGLIPPDKTDPCLEKRLLLCCVWLVEAGFSSYLMQKDKMDVVHSSEENQTVLNRRNKPWMSPLVAQKLVKLQLTQLVIPLFFFFFSLSFHLSEVERSLLSSYFFKALINCERAVGWLPLVHKYRGECCCPASPPGYFIQLLCWDTWGLGKEEHHESSCHEVQREAPVCWWVCW